MSNKRRNVISKDEVYMLIAKIISKRSKDPNTQVGAVIVSEDDRILSIGYNGWPNGIDDDDPKYDWSNRNTDDPDNKYLTVAHSELNAILNYRGDLRDLKGATLYVTLFPCNECAKAIIQTGISRVVYLDDKYHDSVSSHVSRKMFNTTNTEFIQFKPSLESMSNVINSIMILGNSPKYRDIVNKDNQAQLVEDWYNDIIKCIR